MNPEKKLGDYYRLTDLDIFTDYPKEPRITEEQEEIIRTMIFNFCKVTEIARRLNKPVSRIRTFLKRKGLTRRYYVAPFKT